VVSNPTNAGTYTVQIVGTGNYSGTATVTFKITPANLSGMKLSQASYTYDGKAKNPTVMVYGVDGKQLTSADYELATPAGRVNAGTYTYTATGKGNYAGESTVRANLVIAKATLSGLTLATTSYPYDGTSKSPAAARVTAKSGAATITVPTNCYTMSYTNGVTGVQTATATLNAAGAENFTGGPVTATYTITDPPYGVTYRTDVQNIGWQGSASNGEASGAPGKKLRLGGVKIELTDHPYSGSIEYRAQVQGKGWEDGWASDGATSGASAESSGLEAVQVRLTGEMAEHYDVYYSVYVQGVGWTDWAANGAQAGAAPDSRFLEGIKVIMVKKDAVAPGATGDAYLEGLDPIDDSPETQVMYRLYNPYSGEHFYTASISERDDVVAAGWTDEGIGWIAPMEGDPVYRVYNSFAGEHHYTLSVEERDNLVAAGWTDEGIGWYSDPNKSVPLYREYNPYMFSCNHNYTTSREEHDGLVALGWHDEGVAWYGVT